MTWIPRILPIVRWFFVGASLLANEASRNSVARPESALSLTLSLKGEGTVRSVGIFLSQPDVLVSG
jgi:hypothetical protein